jgi:hypothetical protein
MKRFFGSSLAGLYPSLPTIVAELAEELTFIDNGHAVSHDRGSRAYLVLRGQNPMDEDTVECLIRTKINQLRLREVPWSGLRFPEIANVPASIGERCWRGTKEEMQKMLQQIQAKKVSSKPRFAPDVNLD